MHHALEKFSLVISKYVPEPSMNYCLSLWVEHPFHFKVTKRRQTKHGDYLYNPKNHSHSITINGNLNPYDFLITYIHEVAHQRNQLKHGPRIPPHGSLWKMEFTTLMGPLLIPDIFPPDLLIPLKRHMLNPKATLHADASLTKTLKKYNGHQEEGKVYLEEIKTGHNFLFNQRVYKKLEVRRTRALCRDTLSGRKYFIPELAEVFPFY
jgi:hypothetical protein